MSFSIKRINYDKKCVIKQNNMQNLESYVAYYTKTKNFKIRKLYTLAKIEGERGPSFKLIQALSK